MSKRLQVLFDEGEFREIQGAARRFRMTVAEFIRQLVRQAARERSPRDPGGKLDAIRSAYRHSFPAPDIGRMLAEIERGYVEESE